jgi:hypothetical protein
MSASASKRTSPLKFQDRTSVGPPIERADRQRPFPAALEQQRLWFIEQLSPGAPTCNEPFMVKMAGPVDATVLARSLTEITRRPEAWRTVFTTVDGVPFQQIRPNRAFHLPVIDLSDLAPEQREAEAWRHAVNEARRPFDLQNGPLVRALLIRATESDTRLIVTAHHIILDGARPVLPRENAAGDIRRWRWYARPCVLNRADLTVRALWS